MGELIHILLPLPVPASVYGLVLLFLALCLKVVRVEQLEKASGFLAHIMPVLFIPAGVSLITVLGTMAQVVVPFTVIVLVSTVVVMVVTGRVAQRLIGVEKEEAKEPEKYEMPPEGFHEEYDEEALL